MTVNEVAKEPMRPFRADLPTLDKYKMTLPEFKKFCNAIVDGIKRLGMYKKVEVAFVHARLLWSPGYVDAAVIVANNTRRHWIVAVRTKRVESLPRQVLAKTIFRVHESMFGRGSYIRGVSALKYACMYNSDIVAKHINDFLLCPAKVRVCCSDKLKGDDNATSNVQQ